MDKLTAQTVLIANAKAQLMGGYTEGKDYNIKEFYETSCIILDDLLLDDHFFIDDLNKFFTIQNKLK